MLLQVLFGVSQRQPRSTGRCFLIGWLCLAARGISYSSSSTCNYRRGVRAWFGPRAWPQRDAIRCDAMRHALLPRLVTVPTPFFVPPFPYTINVPVSKAALCVSVEEGRGEGGGGVRMSPCRVCLRWCCALLCTTLNRSVWTVWVSYLFQPSVLTLQYRVVVCMAFFVR